MTTQLVDYAGMMVETADRLLSNRGLPKMVTNAVLKLFNSATVGEQHQLNIAVHYLQTAVRTGNRDMLENFYTQFHVRELYPVLFYFIEGLIPDELPDQTE